MKNSEIKKKVCPWLSGIYKHDVNCLGTKCAWLTLVKRFGYSEETIKDEKEQDPEEERSTSLRDLLSPSELPKKDWEYECGLVRNSIVTQSAGM
jgi:hypothetical protein